MKCVRITLCMLCCLFITVQASALTMYSVIELPLSGLAGVDLNNNCKVVGMCQNLNNICIWDPVSGVVDLGLPCERRDKIFINDLGHIAGSSFFYDPISGVTDFSTLVGQGKSVHVTGINDSSQVVGATIFDYFYHAFLWDATNGMRDFRTPGLSRI